jgi:hypothetical protein
MRAYIGHFTRFNERFAGDCDATHADPLGSQVLTGASSAAG